MRRALVLVTVTLAVAAGGTGCGGANMTAIPRIAEAERARGGLQGQDAQTLAPQAFADADLALREAKEARAAGDYTAAELHAERAIASYQRAIAVARLTRATEEETHAKESLAHALEQSERYTAARKAAEREAADLDKQLKIAREAERPTPSGPADPEREKARLVAAQSLVTQARLLCSAARLVSAQAPGLAEAEGETAALEKKLESSPRPAPIDAAAHARASCLSALTKARRSGSPDTDLADQLLGELSRARFGDGADITSARDERGVVVTMRSMFRADKLTAEGETALAELGRVAAAHPSFAVQVVLHDAVPPTSSDVALDKKRGDAISKALSTAGATKTKLELAGAHAPVFDPSDAKRRDKNARVDVVFVGGS
jgi:hypothetical protein